MSYSQSRETGFESPLLPFRSLDIFVLSSTPQFTRLHKWLLGYRQQWKCEWIVVASTWLPDGWMLIREVDWCCNEQFCQGLKCIYSALSGPTDWTLCYIKSYLYFFFSRKLAMFWVLSQTGNVLSAVESVWVEIMRILNEYIDFTDYDSHTDVSLCSLVNITVHCCW